jgi:hypothetical protein
VSAHVETLIVLSVCLPPEDLQKLSDLCERVVKAEQATALIAIDLIAAEGQRDRALEDLAAALKLAERIQKTNEELAAALALAPRYMA